MKKSFADIVQEAEAGLRKRLAAKVPAWAEAVPDLVLPARLNVEQCSSAAAARYKAAVAQRIAGPDARIADLTGGLGVDAWAFAAVATEVLHNEMDPALSAAVQHNFALLGVRNAVFRNIEVRPGSFREILGGFRPDLLYLDPARRSDTGRKVFRLEDCSPDLLALQEELLAVCPRMLVKLSPMADLTLLRRQLNGLAELHVVAVRGECKELLLRLDAAANPKDTTLIVSEIQDNQTYSLPFSTTQVNAPCPGAEANGLTEGKWLFEPGAALMKSDCHAAACVAAGLKKLAPSTQLYVADSPVETLSPFGRFRKILEVQPLDKRTIAEVGRRYPQAEVTARNIPMTSDDLRRRLGVTSGPEIHIYGTTAASRRLLLITEASPN